MKRKKYKPEGMGNPYDLNNAGFRDICPYCGKEKYPNNPNPYDASQWGFREYCNCRD